MNVIKLYPGDLPEFTLAEANSLIPLVERIFVLHENRVQKHLANQRYFMQTHAPEIRAKEAEDAVSNEMARCGVKLWKLGVKVLGNGFIGFNSGVFYWSWRFPDDKGKEISHYHGFNESCYQRHEMKLIRPAEVYE